MLATLQHLYYIRRGIPYFSKEQLRPVCSAMHSLFILFRLSWEMYMINWSPIAWGSWFPSITPVGETTSVWLNQCLIPAHYWPCSPTDSKKPQCLLMITGYHALIRKGYLHKHQKRSVRSKMGVLCQLKRVSKKIIQNFTLKANKIDPKLLTLPFNF